MFNEGSVGENVFPHGSRDSFHDVRKIAAGFSFRWGTAPRIVHKLRVASLAQEQQILRFAIFSISQMLFKSWPCCQTISSKKFIESASVSDRDTTYEYSSSLESQVYSLLPNTNPKYRVSLLRLFGFERMQYPSDHRIGKSCILYTVAGIDTFLNYL